MMSEDTRMLRSMRGGNEVKKFDKPSHGRVRLCSLFSFPLIPPRSDPCFLPATTTTSSDYQLQAVIINP